jgi:hypothetical protein
MNKFFAFAAALVLGTTTLSADVVFDGSAGTGAPPASMGNYTMVAFGDDTRANFATISTVTGPTGDISVSPSLSHRTVGSGGWATWSHGYTGDVYSTGGTSVTITLPEGTKAFRFYAEPNSFSTFTMEAVSDNGTTSGDIGVNGFAGASSFGFYTDDNSDIASIVITIEGSTGFAIGEFSIANCGNPMLSVSLDKTLLWPPNHSMKGIAATVGVTGGCGTPTIELISVTSNESDNGPDDGNTVNDIDGVGTGADYAFRVRAERCGTCTGRIYTVTYKVTDEAGNISYATATVTVPVGSGGGDFE